ncbi:tetratricopeptide repeat protein [Kribbella sp. NPDC058245]|uniref:tetratricopeptide repeat protein n=1 Tax=Kribbella sp. NPDC058245 TaxID=3346399 RepID=UPI0036EF3D5D
MHLSASVANRILSLTPRLSDRRGAAVCRSLMERSPEVAADAAARLGWHLRALGDLAGARQAYESSIEHGTPDRDLYDRYAQLGEINAELDDKPAALEAYRAQLQASRDHGWADRVEGKPLELMERIADLLEQLDRPEQAAVVRNHGRNLADLLTGATRADGVSSEELAAQHLDVVEVLSDTELVTDLVWAIQRDREHDHGFLILTTERSFFLPDLLSSRPGALLEVVPVDLRHVASCVVEPAEPESVVVLVLASGEQFELHAHEPRIEYWARYLAS